MESAPLCRVEASRPTYTLPAHLPSDESDERRDHAYHDDDDDSDIPAGERPLLARHQRAFSASHRGAGERRCSVEKGSSSVSRFTAGSLAQGACVREGAAEQAPWPVVKVELARVLPI